MYAEPACHPQPRKRSFHLCKQTLRCWCWHDILYMLSWAHYVWRGSGLHTVQHKKLWFINIISFLHSNVQYDLLINQFIINKWLYIPLNCVIRLAQMFSTGWKSREILYLLQHFDLWNTRWNIREWGVKRAHRPTRIWIRLLFIISFWNISALVM